MASHRTETFVWSGFFAILVLAPLPSASVSPLAQACLAFSLFALLAISHALPHVWLTQWPPAVERRFRILMLCWTLAMVFAFIQVVPLPPKLLSAISPSLSDLYSWTLPTSIKNNVWRPLSTTPAATVQIGLLIGAYGTAFALVARLCRTRRRMLMLATTIILIGAGEAIMGLARLGGKLDIPASGTFVNRNHFAALLIMALGVSMGLILSLWYEGSAGDVKSNLLQSGMRSERWARISPLFVVSLTIFVAIIFSFSRTGLITSFVMMILFGIFGSLGSLQRFLGFLSLGVGILAALLITGAGRAMRIVANRFEVIEGSYRLAAWEGTYDLFHSSPFVGIGLGGLVDNISRFLPIAIREVFDHTHNEPLEILAEGGILYAGLFVAGLLIYVAAVIPAWFKRRDPLARGLGWGCLVGVTAVFFFSFVEFPLRMPANALALSAVLSLAWVVVHHRSQSSSAREQQRTSSLSSSLQRLILSTAIVGMGISALTASADILDRAGDGLLKQAETMRGDSQQALLKKVVEFYRTAQKIEPWQPAHAFKLGQVFELTASMLPPISEGTKTAWTSATEWYERALRLHPANARIQAALAWAALQSGQLNQSGRAAQAALKLAPAEPNVRFTVAKWYLVQWENLSVKEQESAIALIREGTSDLPLEYMKAIWRFVPDLKTIKSLLPDDLKVKRLLLGELTARQLFFDRWAEQDAHPDLRIPSPAQGVLVIGYGQLRGRQQPPVEAVAGGTWTGMIEGWLSSGLTARARVELPPGEVVIFLPIHGESAGGVWPTLSLTLGGNPIPVLPLAETGWRTAYIHLYTKGGIFPLQAILQNGTVIRENGLFVERRAMLGLIRVLTPESFHSSVGNPPSTKCFFARNPLEHGTQNRPSERRKLPSNGSVCVA